jgi:hypothetical protein
VLAVTGLQMLLAAVTTIAVFYFSLIDAAKPALPVGLAFVAVYWSANAIGLAGSVGLLRRRGLGRTVLVGYGVYEILFSLLKILVWHESASYLFIGVGLVLIALAAAPSTRTWTS